MKLLRSVRPEMGCYYYTRNGAVAYVAYAMSEGSVLPMMKKRRRHYPRAMGMVLNNENPIEWDVDGKFFPSKNIKDYDALDLVEQISMEMAFAHPWRKSRPRPKPPEEQGLLAI